MSLAEALAKHAGGHQLGEGLWRLFSEAFPAGGAAIWNSTVVWKQAWGLSVGAFYAFGEDVFGNQLVMAKQSEAAMIWNHESGELLDLLLPPLELLETCLDSGLDWIDFYTAPMIEVGRVQRTDVPDDCHLHWTTPLILGGTVSPSNTAVLDRTQHLLGHADLWRQVAGLAPGTIVIPKPTLS